MLQQMLRRSHSAQIENILPFRGLTPLNRLGFQHMIKSRVFLSLLFKAGLVSGGSWITHTRFWPEEILLICGKPSAFMGRASPTISFYKQLQLAKNIFNIFFFGKVIYVNLNSRDIVVSSLAPAVQSACEIWLRVWFVICIHHTVEKHKFYVS